MRTTVIAGNAKRAFLPVSSVARQSVSLQSHSGLACDCDGDCGQGDCDCASDCGDGDD